MTWINASVRALAIAAYFVIATVWLPDWLLRLGPIADAQSLVRDGIVLAVWTVALAGGIYGLRRLQRQGVI